jgi:sphingomyelin phosphodiesterase 2
MVLTLSILTFNLWGIPFVSKDKVKIQLKNFHRLKKNNFQDIRIDKIADHFSTSDYDILSLQEVWSEYDYQKIKSRVSCNYPYSHYYYSGMVGSGLCVFSKHKILSAFFHQWSVNGYFHKIQHGDFFGGNIKYYKLFLKILL